MPTPKTPPTHGSRSRYTNQKCRCDRCCEANRTYNRQDIRRRRKVMGEYVTSLKLRTGCADCGYNEHGAALHFDHLPERGGKLQNISDLLNHSKDYINKEIEKCEVVCANCHAIRSFNRGQHFGKKVGI